MNHVDPHVRPRAAEEPRATSAVFPDAARRRILTDFVAHLRNGTGPMVLIGEPGSGKTTLLQQVAEEAAAQRLPLVLPSHGSARSSALLAMIAGLEAQAQASPRERPAGILLDDADEYPVAVWRKLAGLLRDRPPPALPPMILALPPEMLSWLKELVLIAPETLDPRIRRLAPLAPVDVARFLRHRLQAAGHAPPEILPAHAIERIAAATGGMPGRICRLCEDVLAITSARGGSGRVSIEMIATALAGSGGSGAAATPEAGASVSAAGTAIPLAGLLEPPAPLFGDDRLQRGLYRSRPRRRRWPMIIAAGAVAGVAALGAVAAFQAQRPPHYTLATVPDDGPTAATRPAMPGRPDALSEPALQGSSLASPTSPAVPVPSIGEQPPTPTRDAPPTVGDEEAPEIFAPAPVENHEPPTPAPSSPPPPKAAKAKGIPAATGVASTTAKVPPATRRPSPPAAEAPPANADGETETAPEEIAGPPRPVREIIAMGDEFRTSGDIAWARKYYQAAGERGSAKATRALATTYDPRYVDSGELPDPQVARQLYEQANRQGDRGAAKERDDLDQWLNEGR